MNNKFTLVATFQDGTGQPEEMKLENLEFNDLTNQLSLARNRADFQEAKILPYVVKERVFYGVTKEIDPKTNRLKLLDFVAENKQMFIQVIQAYNFIIVFEGNKVAWASQDAQRLYYDVNKLFERVEK